MTSPGPLYGDGARALQDEFDSRRLADRLEQITVHTELNDGDLELIAAQRSFYLSTVDDAGWPDVSYKGGGTGFVRILDDTTLVFPNYDGNGMFRSLGNIVANGMVALLFVDTARPWRLRLHGTAEVLLDDPLVDYYPGALAVVLVTVVRAFPNCGRYIHQGDEISEYVPRAGHEPPEPAWKQSDAIRDHLPNA